MPEDCYARPMTSVESAACAVCKGWYTKLAEVLVPNEVFGEGTGCSCERGPTVQPPRMTRTTSTSLARSDP